MNTFVKLFFIKFPVGLLIIAEEEQTRDEEEERHSYPSQNIGKYTLYQIEVIERFVQSQIFALNHDICRRSMSV